MLLIRALLLLALSSLLFLPASSTTGQSAEGEGLGPWTVAFGGCTFSGHKYDGPSSQDSPLQRTGECPTHEGELRLHSKGITSLPNTVFKGMSKLK
jgi:hypothetical protein